MENIEFDLYKNVFEILKAIIVKLDIKDYVLRMPYQNSPINYKKGYISFYEIGRDIVGTQHYFNNENLNDARFLNANVTNIENVYMRLECERLNNVKDTYNPMQTLTKIKAFLNSYYSIDSFKANGDIALYPINSTIQNLVYFFENRDWIQKATLDFNISYNNTIGIETERLKEIKIIREVIL